MDKAINVIRIVAASILGLFGLVILIVSPMAGIIMLLGSLILIPKIKDLISSKMNYSLKVEASILFALMALAVIFIFASERREKVEKAKKQELKQAAKEERQEAEKILARKQDGEKRLRRLNFEASKTETIIQLKKLISENDIDKASSICLKYLEFNDVDISGIQKEIDGIKKQKRISDLSKELSDTAEGDFKTRISIYQELVLLEPESKEHKEKLNLYIDLNKKKIEQKKQDAVSKKEFTECISVVDGHHLALQRAIKENLKDPDSYKHIETKYLATESGYDIVTKFRSKNSFNGYVISRAFAQTDKSGKVLSWEFVKED